jgi:hypothetical protein
MDSLQDTSARVEALAGLSRFRGLIPSRHAGSGPGEEARQTRHAATRA